jgi:nitroreductase
MTLETNPIIDLIRARRSVRKFKPTPVPDDHVLMVLDAARLAPTSGNQQPWKFLVIRDRQAIEQLKLASIVKTVQYYKDNFELTPEQLAEHTANLEDYTEGFLSAPVFIVVLVDSLSKYPDYNKHDGPLAAQNLMLAARALGYGTVYGTDAVSMDAVRQIFAIPENYKINCFIPVGVPEEWPDMPEKQPLESFIVYEKFS